jgi:hypothetical protein
MSITGIFKKQPSLTTPSFYASSQASQASLMANNAVNSMIGVGMGNAGAMPMSPHLWNAAGSMAGHNDRQWNMQVNKIEDGFILSITYKGDTKQYIAKDAKELTDKILSAMVLSKITNKNEGAQAYAQASNGGN